MTFDAIVVGARCAGSPLAMLLARKHYKVLVVDKASFPSDTVSTHLLHPPGVAAMKRWGLLDRLLATGCPPIETYAFDFGPFTLSGSPGMDEAPASYAPRRTLLDKLLVDAASEAGAEVREGFGVDDILFDDGRVTGIAGRTKHGSRVTERARVVVGADGLGSYVARAVRADKYNERGPLLQAYYGYWSGLAMDGRFEAFVRPYRSWAAWPTHDGLTLVIGGWPFAERAAHKNDVQRDYNGLLESTPAFADRVRAARCETRLVGMSVPNFFRKPFGPGWVLVGDAGYNKDFITAQGMLDAFRDAELCAAALDQTWSGARSFDAAMAEYQATRDAHVTPMYEFTCQLASLEPPSADLQRVLAAAHGTQDAMDGFVKVNAGVISPAEFFSPENAARIVAAAG
jgi:2-polyprenyl-6-methoxyphenol hydroxylase-like FAD-dependent oxidoreductase